MTLYCLDFRLTGLFYVLCCGLLLLTVVFLCVFFFFFKQKTAYEMRISDWSSDVCSSDLDARRACRSSDLGARWSTRPIIGGASEAVLRSEERRVGKECVSTCRSRWSPYH